MTVLKFPGLDGISTRHRHVRLATAVPRLRAHHGLLSGPTQHHLCHSRRSSVLMPPGSALARAGSAPLRSRHLLRKAGLTGHGRAQGSSTWGWLGVSDSVSWSPRCVFHLLKTITVDSRGTFRAIPLIEAVSPAIPLREVYHPAGPKFLHHLNFFFFYWNPLTFISLSQNNNKYYWSKTVSWYLVVWKKPFQKLIWSTNIFSVQGLFICGSRF